MKHVFLILFLLLPARLKADAVSNTDCFPVEKLPRALRDKASEVLVRALDTAALYTVAAPMKAMSGDFASFAIEVGSRDGARVVEEFKKIVSALHCGEVHAELHAFDSVLDGRQHYSAMFFNKKAFDRVTGENAEFFSGLGDVRDRKGEFSMSKVLQAVDQSSPAIRYRGFGLLYGFPKEAIDFFVASDANRKDGEAPSPREPVGVPTYASKDMHFVWVMPVGHAETPEEVAIRERAAPVLRAYRKVREAWVKSGERSIVSELRAWFKKDRSTCDPAMPETRICEATLTSAGR